MSSAEDRCKGIPAPNQPVDGSARLNTTREQQRRVRQAARNAVAAATGYRASAKRNRDRIPEQVTG